MKQDIKKLWVDALRSGEYNQARHCLQSNTGFCCLGVLSDLYIKQNPNSGCFWEPDEKNMAINFVAGNYCEYDILPEMVVTWAGLPDKNPKVIGTNDEGLEIHDVIANFNDRYRKDFEQIADMIEAQL